MPGAPLMHSTLSEAAAAAGRYPCGSTEATLAIAEAKFIAFLGFFFDGPFGDVIDIE